MSAQVELVCDALDAVTIDGFVQALPNVVRMFILFQRAPVQFLESIGSTRKMPSFEPSDGSQWLD